MINHVIYHIINHTINYMINHMISHMVNHPQVDLGTMNTCARAMFEHWRLRILYTQPLSVDKKSFV